VHFATKVSLKSTLNSASFDTHEPHIVKNKILEHYIVLDTEKNDLSSKGHLTKKTFFAVFRVFS
jgi:hypothetical protein